MHQVIGNLIPSFAAAPIFQKEVLKGVVSKNLQKTYICDQGGYNSWSDDAYQGQQMTLVDTIGLGAIPPYATFCGFL